jgi:hypothetical protein
LEDRRISAKSIPEQLGISRERVGSIIHEDLDKLVAWVLPGRAKDLSAPQYLIKVVILLIKSGLKPFKVLSKLSRMFSNYFPFK